jgi:iron complex outermembrane receptor protein
MKAFAIAVCTLLALGQPSTALAQAGRVDWAALTLEDLLNTRISSVGRKEQLVRETAAAAYVITQEDIRRSGIRTLPELFRLVPGMHVAVANAGTWAMGVRGFSDVYADKLLVLVDGRSVYNQNFSGVLWDMEDLLVDDIEHIEVIRGAGGAEWGANAVSGVINIITKSSEHTKGTLVRVGTGTLDPMQAAVRYGGALGTAAFRVSSQRTNHGASRIDKKTPADDDWTSVSNSARVDWRGGANTLMLHGGFLMSRPRPMWFQTNGPTGGTAASLLPSDRTNTSALARWTREDSGLGTLRAQFSFTRLYMAEISATEVERISDVDAQYRRPIGDRHDVVFGGGYRRTRTALSKETFGYSITPALSTTAVANVFGQDEIWLAERLKTTVGAKVERETLSGWSVQPAVRAVWTLAPSQRVWAAMSRAVRTPSGSDRGIDLKFAAFPGADGRPTVLGVIGNPELRSETVTDRQVGYRFHVGSKLAVDVSAFRGDYTRLQTAEPVAPMMRSFAGTDYTYAANRYDNLLAATTTGVEVFGHWAATTSWLVKGSYSGFGVTPHVSPLSTAKGAGAALRNTPAHQWQVQSTMEVGPRAELTLGLFHVGRVTNLNVPAHTKADVNLEVRASRALSIVVSGRDLLDPIHAEFPSWSVGMRTTSVPRSASVQVVWRR